MQDEEAKLICMVKAAKRKLEEGDVDFSLFRLPSIGQCLAGAVLNQGSAQQLRVFRMESVCNLAKWLRYNQDNAQPSATAFPICHLSTLENLFDWLRWLASPSVVVCSRDATCFLILFHY